MRMELDYIQIEKTCDIISNFGMNESYFYSRAARYDLCISVRRQALRHDLTFAVNISLSLL